MNSATAICKAIKTLAVAEERAEQLVTRAVKATNRPELYREVREGNAPGERYPQ
jgi:hypothetical protein